MTAPASKPNPVLWLMGISAAVSAVSALAGFNDYVPDVVAFWIMAGNVALTAILAVVLRQNVVPLSATAARVSVDASGITTIVAGPATPRVAPDTPVTVRPLNVAA